MTKPFKTPRPYLVMVTVTPNGKNGIREPFTARVGFADDPKNCARLVREDLAAMGQTFGGLIEPTDTGGRTYRAFKAEWTEVPIPGVKS